MLLINNSVTVYTFKSLFYFLLIHKTLCLEYLITFIKKMYVYYLKED